MMSHGGNKEEPEKVASDVDSGPFVRSSFHAGDMFNRIEARKGDVIFAAGKT